MKTRWFALAAVAAALLSACGAKTNTPAAQTSSTAPAVVVDARALSKLGTALVDGRGMTLYLNTKEKDGKIVCTGQCATNWPALTVPAGTTAMAGNGVRASLLGTVMRPDGTFEVTYNKWPLHMFAGDAAAGDTHGQGFAGIWFAVTTKGVAAGAPAPKPSTRTSPSPTASTMTHATTTPKPSTKTSPTPKTSPKPTHTATPTPTPTSTCLYPPCY